MGGVAVLKRLSLLMLLSIGVGCSVLTGSQPNDAPHVRGKAVYEKTCLPCHGAQGKGDGYPFLKPPPADLTSFEVRSKTDTQLLSTIREGHRETAMGAWKVVLSDEESRHVLAYVRTLTK